MSELSRKVHYFFQLFEKKGFVNFDSIQIIHL